MRRSIRPVSNSPSFPPSLPLSPSPTQPNNSIPKTPEYHNTKPPPIKKTTKKKCPPPNTRPTTAQAPQAQPQASTLTLPPPPTTTTLPGTDTCISPTRSRLRSSLFASSWARESIRLASSRFRSSLSRGGFRGSGLGRRGRVARNLRRGGDGGGGTELVVVFFDLVGRFRRLLG